MECLTYKIEKILNQIEKTDPYIINYIMFNLPK